MNNTYQQILAEFFHTEATKDYSLDNIRAACAYFGNPEESLKCIHIAGTNGKGSVSKMVFQMLVESGRRVWVYTSPHNIDLRERFETQDWLISEMDFMTHVTDILAYDGELAYFDRCVLLAFLYFRSVGCEYVVLEVWLGGRLDSTNIVTPILSIITSISYDHQEFLGDTLEEIAYEKWGIIKPWVPVILYSENPILEHIARERSSRVIFPALREIETNLLGEHQISNGRIAYEAGIFLSIPPTVIQSALLHVHHDGRLQYVETNLLIDGAHNEGGLAKLQNYLHDEKENWDEIIYCANLRVWKSAEILVDAFPDVSDWSIVDTLSSRVCRADMIATEMISLGRSATIITPTEIRYMAQQNPDTLFVVFGSLYMLSEFLDL